MLCLYKHSLIDLFEQVQNLSVHPQENYRLCLQIQEGLIKKITYIEHRIQDLKFQIKHLRGSLKVKRDIPFTKSEANKIKSMIAHKEDMNKQYQLLLCIFRQVGDALTFIYIDKWDIKPMAFKQASGFISGKKGGRLERKILRKLYEHGVVAIMNDLTNCLRYGDITVVNNNGALIFEVKSGKRKRLNSEDQRQVDEINRIMTYILTDRVDKLYDQTGNFARLPLKDIEVNHTVRLNDLMSKYTQNSHCVIEIETGLYYYIFNHFDLQVIKDAVRSFTGKTIVTHLNSMTYNNTGYYPFTLSIKHSDLLYKFYADEIHITVLIDFGIIEQKFTSYGFTVHYLDDKNWALSITSPKLNLLLDAPIRISWHLFGRIFAEFLSLDWFVHEMIEFTETSINHVLKSSSQDEH